jgi:RNA polymerase sigma factor (TIGR02999 family)
MMASRDPATVTRLLRELDEGDATALNRLAEAIYDDLHSVATRMMRAERVDHTDQPTSLAHEAFLRLFGDEAFLARASQADRNYIYAAATRAMGLILIDRARQRRAEKRGGGRMVRNPLDVVLDRYEQQNLDAVEMRDAIEELGKLHQRASTVVTLRVFGFTLPEVAERLGISVSTAEADFRFARAYLCRQFDEES